MPTGKIDIIEGARVIERGGLITELDRIAYVSGLTGNDATLVQALSGAGFSGDAMPQPGDVHPSQADLLLEDRVAVPISDSQSRVTLTYRWNPNPMQLIGGGGGVESVFSERLGPNSDDDPIILQHPHSGLNSSGVREQGARISVTASRSSTTGIVSIATPDGAKQAQRHVDMFKNKINADQFLTAGDEKQWKVTNGDWEPVSRDTNGKVTRAKFTFTFQNKSEGWNPVTVVATDRSGLPYSDVSSQVTARLDILWFEEISFSTISTISA